MAHALAHPHDPLLEQGIDPPRKQHSARALAARFAEARANARRAARRVAKR